MVDFKGFENLPGSGLGLVVACMAEGGRDEVKQKENTKKSKIK